MSRPSQDSTNAKADLSSATEITAIVSCQPALRPEHNELVAVIAKKISTETTIVLANFDAIILSILIFRAFQE